MKLVFKNIYKAIHKYLHCLTSPLLLAYLLTNSQLCKIKLTYPKLCIYGWKSLQLIVSHFLIFLWAIW